MALASKLSLSWAPTLFVSKPHLGRQRHRQVLQIFATSVTRGWWTRIHALITVFFVGEAGILLRSGGSTRLLLFLQRAPSCSTQDPPSRQRIGQFCVDHTSSPSQPRSFCTRYRCVRLPTSRSAPSASLARRPLLHRAVPVSVRSVLPDATHPQSLPHRPAVPIPLTMDRLHRLSRLRKTTRGLGAFLGASLEDVARTLCTAASKLRTRNLWELAAPPANAFPLAGQNKHTVRLCRESFLRSRHHCVVSDDGVIHACFHLLQHPGCCPIEHSEVASDSEPPLGPGHPVGSFTQIDVTAEHRESSNLFRIDTSWPCFHRLLSDLSSLTSKSFHNQRSLRLSQTVLQRSQPCFHGQTQAPPPCGTR